MKKLFAEAEHESLGHPFGSIHRIRLLLMVLDEFTIKSDQATLAGLDTLMHNDILLSYFPLHSDEYRNYLWKEWNRYDIRPDRLPIDLVKDYLGEKIGLYFQFLVHYTSWLIILSITGILMSIVILNSYVLSNSYTQALQSPFATPVYCCLASVWTIFMLEVCITLYFLA